VRSDDKKAARLNVISHVLHSIPYKRIRRDKVTLPKRSMKHAYDDDRSIRHRRFVKERYS
jgi:hypothetical protein